MWFITISYRSFAPLRMTTKRDAVILSGAKDLYTRITNNDLLDLMALGNTPPNDPFPIR